MGELRTLALFAAAIAFLAKAAIAANITVGSPNGGWDQNTDLQSWASSRTFRVGDNLIFQYSTTHDVLEVTKANYDSCQASNPLRSYNGGDTVISITSPGRRHFICGTAGHCSQGMKLEIDAVVAASSPSPSPAPKSPTVKAPSPASPPKKAPTPSTEKGSPPASPSSSPSDVNPSTAPSSTSSPARDSAPAPSEAAARLLFSGSAASVLGFGLLVLLGV